MQSNSVGGRPPSWNSMNKHDSIVLCTFFIQVALVLNFQLFRFLSEMLHETSSTYKSYRRNQSKNVVSF